MRRPANRPIRSSIGTSIRRALSTCRPDAASAASSASAWGRVRGNPSRIAPAWALRARAGPGRGGPSRRRGRARPAHDRSTSRPISLPRATSARNRSPDARTGTPRLAESRGACVPLPAPGRREGCDGHRRPRGGGRGRPTRRGRVDSARSRGGGGRRPSADEAFVVAHHELGLDLLHRLDDDETTIRRPVPPSARPTGSGRQTPTSDRRDGDDRQEQRAGERDPADDPGQVVLRRPARPDARDEAAVLAELLRGLVGFEREGRVEVREADGQQEVEDDVQDRRRLKKVTMPLAIC